MDSLELILSNQEADEKYREFNEKGILPPYFYEIERDGQRLFFLGAKHIHDPEDKQNKVIKSYWQNFLKITNKENCIVLNEGGTRPTYNSEEDAIQKDGEAGLIIRLARQEGIETFSPEPDLKSEIDNLLNKFSQDEIIYYYFARLVNQWHRFKEKPDFEHYFDPYFKRYKEVNSWKDFDFSVEYMIRVHNQTHDHEFNKEDRECVYTDSHPGRNRVAEADSRLRNEHIFAEIKRLWDEDRNIFIVYGSGHFIVLEKAIKSLAN